MKLLLTVFVTLVSLTLSVKAFSAEKTQMSGVDYVCSSEQDDGFLAFNLKSKKIWTADDSYKEEGYADELEVVQLKKRATEIAYEGYLLASWNDETYKFTLEGSIVNLKSSPKTLLTISATRVSDDVLLESKHRNFDCRKLN